MNAMGSKPTVTSRQSQKSAYADFRDSVGLRG